MPHSDPSHLVRLLAETARLISRDAARHARAQGMSRAQWAILDTLEQSPGLTQRELAERLEVEPITVARMLDRLQARELVERRPDPHDRRIWRLHFGPGAAAVRSELADRRAALAQAVTDELPDALRDGMEQGLARVVAALEAAPATSKESV